MGRDNFSTAAYLAEVLQRPFVRFRNYENIDITFEFTENKKGSRVNFSRNKQLSVKYGIDESQFETLVVIPVDPPILDEMPPPPPPEPEGPTGPPPPPPEIPDILF